jgi:hypothetical protein
MKNGPRVIGSSRYPHPMIENLKNQKANFYYKPET